MISSRNRHCGKRSAADLPPDTEHDDRDERKPADGCEDLQKSFNKSRRQANEQQELGQTARMTSCQTVSCTMRTVTSPVTHIADTHM